MASVSKYCNTVSQTTGGKFRSFSNLNNIKNNTVDSHAVSSGLIEGKSESPNRPSTVTCTNFKFNLPVGAEPTKVTVVYRHRKDKGTDWTSSNKRIMNIPAPTVSLVGVSGFSGKGVAPTTTMTSQTKTFNVTGKLTRAQVNSTGFGAKVDYPTNSNAYNGYMRISYIYITVEYKLSSYSVSVKKVDGGYNGDPYTVQLSISNKNLTSYNPTLTLTTPLGFSFNSANGTGSITSVNSRTFTWNPQLKSSVGTSSINVVFDTNITFPSGSSSYTGTFTLSESLNGTNNSHTATITPKPSEVEEEEDPSDDPTISDKDVNPTLVNIVSATVGQEITNLEELFNASNNVVFMFPCGADNQPIEEPIDDIAEFYDETTDEWYPVTICNPNYEQAGKSKCFYDYVETSSLNYDKFRFLEVGKYILLVYRQVLDPDLSWAYPSFWYSDYEDSADLGKVFFEVKPEESSLTIPYFNLLEPTEEEKDRLGEGYTYIVQSFLKNTTGDVYNRDWYKNKRIGVFNNPITDNITVTETEDPETGEIIETITDSTDYTSLSLDEIFTYAEYWSGALSNVNVYENLECEFTYNPNYPLYILITGEYPEASSTYHFYMGTISYTEPCIIEKTQYKQHEENGTYPVPIENLLNGIAETSIGTLNTTSTIVFYDNPVEDTFGTDETHSIRGIEVTGNIEQSNELVLNASLVNPKGETGTRTTIINNENTTVDGDDSFSLGGIGDNWGFNSIDLTHFDDWELKLFVNNILYEDVANINFGDLQIIFYIETLEKQNINVQVEGEDLSYYGAFIEDVTIPEGLETDTEFLTVDGTDTNDAYRQNIREKVIEIELSIGECDLQTSTDMLRRLTKVLVNEKDNYNRPIPKHITFSHYPDVYFEYIMKDALDISNETSYYTVKAKLIIPSGTAYSKMPTTTNISGFVQGLAAVNPVITVKPQSSSISILEQVTGQKFDIGYSGDWQTKIVEIDCEDRVAYLKTNEDDTQPIDISKHVNFNSDWFSLKGEYSFAGTNCVIRTVEYTERW